MGKPLIAAVVVTVVILTECVLAYLLIPSSTQLDAHFHEKAEAQTKAVEAEAHAEAHGKPEEEVELGKFNLVMHQPASNVTMRISFHLIGTVEEAEKETFSALLAKNQHRLRDQVIFEIRSSEMSELTDPGLALIKRKILAKSNELLGKPLLRTIVFSEFAFIEQ